MRRRPTWHRTRPPAGTAISSPGPPCSPSSCFKPRVRRTARGLGAQAARGEPEETLPRAIPAAATTGAWSTSPASSCATGRASPPLITSRHRWPGKRTNFTELGMYNENGNPFPLRSFLPPLSRRNVRTRISWEPTNPTCANCCGARPGSRCSCSRRVAKCRPVSAAATTSGTRRNNA